MQEKVIKFNEHLTRRGKQLADITEDEFFELAEKVGMNVALPHAAEGDSPPKEQS